MQSAKPLQFQATAGSYFVFTIVTIILSYIPIFGWAFLLNYASEWFADRTEVNGRAIKYQAGYGESLKFVFVNTLLLAITLGIYSFWFYPKMYRYVVDHVSNADEATPAPVPAPETPEVV
ncbi:MAG: hypothetical protein WC498_00585 [Candidatus Saccharimonadales bacterium]